MSEQHCPELEQLFNELAEGEGPALAHAKDCPACSAILEEHRQLEKDLYRLADPLPPPDFVQKVMARVAQEPKPVGSELKVGLSILAAAVMLAVLSFVATGAGAGALGSGVATYLVSVRTFFAAVSNGLISLWQVAGFPIAAASFVLLIASLFGLRRLATVKPEEAEGARV